MENKKSRLKKKTIVAVCLLLLVVFGLVLLIFSLFSNNVTTIVSEGDLNSRKKALVCVSYEKLDNPFFIDNSLNNHHTIKILLDDTKIQSFFYVYDTSFSTEEEAKREVPAVRAKYNIDLANNNINVVPEAQFDYIDKNGRISINADVNEINVIIGKYFFLEDVIANNIQARNDSEIKSYYERLGFSCEYK